MGKDEQYTYNNPLKTTKHVSIQSKCWVYVIPILYRQMSRRHANHDIGARDMWKKNPCLFQHSKSILPVPSILVVIGLGQANFFRSGLGRVILLTVLCWSPTLTLFWLIFWLKGILLRFGQDWATKYRIQHYCTDIER